MFEKYDAYSPDKVYLHAGTKEGAKNLGLNTKGKKALQINELPKELKDLSPIEIEDILCIYRDKF
ncbi:MAG: hypothetical protein ABIN73_07505 [candidate division WOR-3 bacterium]